MKKVLILGAGMVAKPIVSYLLKHNFYISLADMHYNKAEELINNHTNGKAVEFSIENSGLLNRLVEGHDIVVSLLPYKFHVKVAKACIRYSKDMLTTSYVSEEMEALNKQAKDAGIIILNELGLDPGIDHMSAMRIIDYIHDKGGKVINFHSITGALPAREAVDTPFAYKFSWSPKGVIMASNNHAQYLKDGKNVEVPTKDLFKNTFFYNFPEVGKLEAYPNRDSIKYIDIYGIPEAKTVFRGTFRYEGWCKILDKMKAMNLIKNDTYDFTGMSYRQFVEKMLDDNSNASTQEKINKHFGTKDNKLTIRALEFIDMFSDEDMGYEIATPFEITSDRMISKMLLPQDANDMIAMQHVFLAEYPNKTREVIKSRLLNFGNLKTETAVARTVALPAAVGVKNILAGKIVVKGVHRPVHKSIYATILNELETLGIKMIEEFGLPESENI